MRTECTNGGDTVYAPANNQLINNLSDLINSAFWKEIEDYNRALENSDAWKARKEELLKTDFLVLSLLDQELKRVKEIYPSITAYLGVDNIVQNTLNEEFGIIDTTTIIHNSVYGSYPVTNLIDARLATLTITDVDTTITSTIDWLKEKFEIYI